jgi:hypothetical protein
VALCPPFVFQHLPNSPLHWTIPNMFNHITLSFNATVFGMRNLLPSYWLSLAFRPNTEIPHLISQAFFASSRLSPRL